MILNHVVWVGNVDLLGTGVKAWWQKSSVPFISTINTSVKFRSAVSTKNVKVLSWMWFKISHHSGKVLLWVRSKKAVNLSIHEMQSDPIQLSCFMYDVYNTSPVVRVPLFSISEWSRTFIIFILQYLCDLYKDIIFIGFNLKKKFVLYLGNELYNVSILIFYVLYCTV